MDMTDFSPLLHAAVALGLQCLMGLAFGDWVIGGIIGCVWFIAREHTQAEYRWIEQFGAGKRANMPWYGGFDYRAWDIPSLLDWLMPVVSCLAVYMVKN